ncbi:hypothetical protein, partial [Salmonella sp. s51228]|uniref:hypothetical protein n=1 Tax=Salmonella sp. s51228 TaxID=3159652 RepID=UPI003980BE18
NALSVPWVVMTPFMFSSFVVIPQVLRRCRVDQLPQGLLMAAVWPKSTVVRRSAISMTMFLLMGIELGLIS